MPTGIALALPDGYVALVHPRSGLAARHGLSIVNTPGTIDAGYRGEIKVLLVNHDPREPVELRRGDRVAQLVVQRFERARFVAVDELPESRARSRGLRFYRGFRPPTDTDQQDPARKDAREVPPQGSRSDDLDDDRSTRSTDAGRRGETSTRPRATVRSTPTTSTTPRAGSTSARCVLLPVPGTELQLQVDEASGNVQSVMFAGPEGALELRVFAAPRHGDLWSEVRPQIAADLGRRGGTATEREGRFGTELVCQMPVTLPDGKSGTAAVAGHRHQRHPLAAARHPAGPAGGRARDRGSRSRRR